MNPARTRIFETNRTLIVTLVLAGLLRVLSAQEAPALTPSSSPIEAARNVRISFVPPPIEGTISLGIYDANGKLVRVLQRESTTDDLTIGHDALMTEWDGKNDDGQDLPAGKYNARGYAVGALPVEGVDYFFNDWVSDDNSPHVKKIRAMKRQGNKLRLEVEFPSGEQAALDYDFATDSLTRATTQSETAAIPAADLKKMETVIDPMAFTNGREGTIWVIDRPEKDSNELEVNQLSAKGEILRRLAYAKDDPQPRAIAASLDQDRIFVLEENAKEERVRGLSLVATKTDAAKQQIVSDWKVDFEKTIVTHEDFSIENDKPVAVSTAARIAPEKMTQKLQPNLLQPNKSTRVELAVGFDADGSYLETSDGLPLKTISETPNVARALLVGSRKNTIDVFQDDGAVVEQYRISGADQMMAFDCGDFELK